MGSRDEVLRLMGSVPVGDRGRKFLLTLRHAAFMLPRMGDGESMARDVAAELDELETMRAATLAVTRDACDWPALRTAILSQHGGIGPSPDWPHDWYPGDLYRARGGAPDLVATSTYLGTADVPPWGPGGDDAAMFAYLQRSWGEWQRVEVTRAALVVHRVPAPVRRAAAAAPAQRTGAAVKTGTRRYGDLVAELQRRHGADVDLSGLLRDYVAAYESGERIEVVHDGREYRGTVGATRGPKPRFVLLVSLPL